MPRKYSKKKSAPKSPELQAAGLSSNPEAQHLLAELQTATMNEDHDAAKVIARKLAALGYK